MSVSFVRIKQLTWEHFSEEDNQLVVDILAENRIPNDKKDGLFDIFDMTPDHELKRCFESIFVKLTKNQMSVDWLAQTLIGQRLKSLGLEISIVTHVLTDIVGDFQLQFTIRVLCDLLDSDSESD